MAEFHAHICNFTELWRSQREERWFWLFVRVCVDFLSLWTSLFKKHYVQILKIPTVQWSVVMKLYLIQSSQKVLLHMLSLTTLCYSTVSFYFSASNDYFQCRRCTVLFFFSSNLGILFWNSTHTKTLRKSYYVLICWILNDHALCPSLCVTSFVHSSYLFVRHLSRHTEQNTGLHVHWHENMVFVFMVYFLYLCVF